MAVRESIGTADCLCCGQLIPVKASGGGAISVSCPWCDLSAYAKRGTRAFNLISSKIVDAEEKDAKPAPATAKPAPAPAAPKPAPSKSTVFG